MNTRQEPCGFAHAFPERQRRGGELVITNSSQRDGLPGDPHVGGSGNCRT
jgi:hypothetical protein